MFQPGFKPFNKLFTFVYYSAYSNVAKMSRTTSNDGDPSSTFFDFVHTKFSNITSLALWKHRVNLLLQSFRSVSSDLHQCLRIENFAVINLRGVSTKLN